MVEKIETDEAWNRFQKALKISKELLGPDGIRNLTDWEQLFTPIESYSDEIPVENIEEIKDARIRVMKAVLKNAGYVSASDATWDYVKELTLFALNSGPILRISFAALPLSPFRG